jgi:cytochrome c peroxidase
MTSRHASCFSLISALCSLAGAQGLPPVSAPFENPITPAKALLGKILFWDEQLASDGTVACGTCHRPGTGGADPREGRHPGFDGTFGTGDDAFGSPGIVRSAPGGAYVPSVHFGLRVQITGRTAPSNVGAAYFSALRWDGLAGETFVDPQTRQARILLGGALESHAAGPPVVDVEMAYAQRTWNDVVARLSMVRPLRIASSLPPDLAAAMVGDPDYGELMRRVYGDRGISAERVIFALATYQRTLVPDQSPWDRYVVGNTSALTSEQRAGLALFAGAARCGRCHPAPLFSDDGFHNLGLRPAHEDIGWQAVTNDPADRGKFKTPSLRNAGLRARFMHTGRLRTLAEVVDLYDRGGGPFPDNKDPQLIPLGLSAAQKAALVDFVANALVDPRVATGQPPFDRPVLHSERAPGPFGDELAGSGGFVPRPLADAPLAAGNATFRLGLADALGSSIAVLAMGFSPAPGQRIAGIPFNLGLSPPPLALTLATSGTGPGQGHATLQFALPPWRSAIGAPLYHQWLVADPGAAAGIAASRGAGGTLF